MIFAPKVLSKYRQSICNKCDHREPILNRCKQCGCFLSAKTKIMNTNCPLNKWASPITTWGIRFKILNETN